MVSTVCTVLRAGHRPPHRAVSTAHDAAAGAVHLGDRVQQHEHLHDRLVPDALGGRLQDMSTRGCHPGTCRATPTASKRRADRHPGTRITPTLPTPNGPPAHEQVGRVREAGVRLVRAVAPRAEAPNRSGHSAAGAIEVRQVWGHRKPTKAFKRTSFSTKLNVSKLSQRKGEAPSRACQHSESLGCNASARHPWLQPPSPMVAGSQKLVFLPKRKSFP